MHVPERLYPGLTALPKTQALSLSLSLSMPFQLSDFLLSTLYRGTNILIYVLKTPSSKLKSTW